MRKLPTYKNDREVAKEPDRPVAKVANKPSIEPGPRVESVIRRRTLLLSLKAKFNLIKLKIKAIIALWKIISAISTQYGKVTAIYIDSTKKWIDIK